MLKKKKTRHRCPELPRSRGVFAGGRCSLPFVNVAVRAKSPKAVPRGTRGLERFLAVWKDNRRRLGSLPSQTRPRRGARCRDPDSFHLNVALGMAPGAEGFYAALHAPAFHALTFSFPFFSSRLFRVPEGAGSSGSLGRPARPCSPGTSQEAVRAALWRTPPARTPRRRVDVAGALQLPGSDQHALRLLCEGCRVGRPP